MLLEYVRIWLYNFLNISAHINCNHLPLKQVSKKKVETVKCSTVDLRYDVVQYDQKISIVFRIEWLRDISNWQCIVSFADKTWPQSPLLVCVDGKVLHVLQGSLRQGDFLRFHAFIAVNTLRPRQNDRHFPDDIFKSIFLNENAWISIKFSLKFVPKGRINNIPTLVQIMAWRRLGDKPLSEPMMVNSLTHICVSRPQWVKLSETTHFQNIIFKNIILFMIGI